MAHPGVRGPMLVRSVQGGYFDWIQLGGWMVGADERLGVPLSGSGCDHGTNFVVHPRDVSGQRFQPTSHSGCLDGMKVQLVSAQSYKEERSQGYVAVSSLSQFIFIFILKR